MLLSLVLFLIAFMMILFLNIFIEISIKDRIFFAFTVNIFTFYIFPKSGEKSGKSQSKRRKKRNKFTTFKLIPVLIEKSRIKISEINVPDILTGNGILPEFLAKPIALTLLTAMVVYLRSKS